jgi:Ca-activated chloride channel family protein
MAALWARRRIESLTDSLLDGASPQTVRDAVVDLALRHRLVTRYTSLVAVDVTPARPRDADFVSSLIPLHMPHGWSHQAVFGALPQTASGFMLHVLISALAALSAALLWRKGKA